MLRSEAGLTLREELNISGEMVATDALRLRDGVWERLWVCPNSALLGLGVCQCWSHPAREWVRVSRREALECFRCYQRRVA